MVAPHNRINPTPQIWLGYQDKWCHLYAKIFIICTLKLFLWEHSELLTWSEMAWESRGKGLAGALMVFRRWGCDGGFHVGAGACVTECPASAKGRAARVFLLALWDLGGWQAAEMWVVTLESYHQTAEAESYALLHQYYLFSRTYVHNIRMFFSCAALSFNFSLFCDNTRISWKWSWYSEQDT